MFLSTSSIISSTFAAVFSSRTACAISSGSGSGVGRSRRGSSPHMMAGRRRSTWLQCFQRADLLTWMLVLEQLGSVSSGTRTSTARRCSLSWMARWSRALHGLTQKRTKEDKTGQ